MKKERKIVLVGGGSGGHVTPLREIAGEILSLEDKVDVLVISNLGYRKRTEHIFKGLLNDHSERLTLKFIHGGKFRRYSRPLMLELLDFKTQLLNLKDLFKFMAGFIESKWILVKVKPMVVFCKSGTGALEFCLAARKKSPLITHDSDSRLSLTNKILSRFAVLNLFGLPKSIDDIDSDGVVGIPIGAEFKVSAEVDKLRARSSVGLTNKGWAILVYGGSLGAKIINEIIFANLEGLNCLGVHIYHQVGSAEDLERAEEFRSNLEYPGRYVPFEFSDEISRLYAAVDLVIARCGATTIQEIANAGIPSVLIPAPLSDQQKNAKLLYKLGASEILAEGKLMESPGLLLDRVRVILEDERLRKSLSDSVLRLAKYNSTKQISGVILKNLDMGSLAE